MPRNITMFPNGAGIANGLAGTFTCNGTTAVTVTAPDIKNTDVIIVSLNTVGGTVGAVPSVKTITSGTGFTISGSASDTSVYNWIAISRER